MSMNNLTLEGEFRYIVQWFNEWSELQRDDFVPILLKFLTGSHVNDDDDNDEISAVATPVNMNGIPNDFEFNGRPMSLFQCRIKLFNQWNRRWPIEFKEKLQRKVTEIDSNVGEKIKLALNPNSSESLTNGCASISQHQQTGEQLKENTANFVNVLEVEDTVLSDPMADVLSNETSVDDFEANENMNNNIDQPLCNNSRHTEDDDVVFLGNDNKFCSHNTKFNHAINEREELVEQVMQMQNLQINEEKTEKQHEDGTTTVEQKHQELQQPPPSVTITVNPVIVAQTISTNAEVPLVV